MMLIPISHEAKDAIGFSKRRDIIAPLEICPSTHKLCIDYSTATALQFQKVGKIPQGSLFNSPCSKQDYNKYKIACPDCKEKLGEVYAKDKTLSDWRGLRYFSWYDSKEWHATRGVNTKDDIMKIECSCDPILNKKEVWDKYKTGDKMNVRMVR